MIVGFTGTQDGMTTQQKQWLNTYLAYFKCDELRHGDCQGSDAQAHEAALDIAAKIVIHPPNHASKRAFCDKKTFDGVQITVMPQKWYIDRNHDIVDACEVLIATPKEYEEKVRSGTWATIRYAKKTKKQLIIIHPDGTSKSYNIKNKQA
jgi:hypothetical protein